MLTGTDKKLIIPTAWHSRLWSRCSITISNMTVAEDTNQCGSQVTPGLAVSDSAEASALITKASISSMDGDQFDQMMEDTEDEHLFTAELIREYLRENGLYGGSLSGEIAGYIASNPRNAKAWLTGVSFGLKESFWEFIERRAAAQAVPVTVSSDEVPVSSDDVMPSSDDVPVSSDEVMLSCDERVLQLCQEGDSTALAQFLKANRTVVERDYNDWAAWKYCVAQKDAELCKVFADHFGYNIISASSSFVGACATGQMDTAELLFDLAPERLALSNETILAACRKGYVDLANKILDAWTDNNRTSKINILVMAIYGSMDGGREDMFDAMLDRYVKSGPSKESRKYYNRGLLIMAACRGKPMFMRKLLDRLDFEYDHDSDSDMGHYEFSIDKGFSLLTDGLRKIFRICGADKNPLMVQTLIDTFGSEIKIDNEYRACLVSACSNNHTDAVQFFLSKYEFTDIISLFRICIKEGSTETVKLLVSKHGLALVPLIEADGPVCDPTVRLVLREYYLEKALSYED